MPNVRMQVSVKGGTQGCRGWIGQSRHKRATRRLERHEVRLLLNRGDDELPHVERRRFRGWVW